MPRAWPRRRRRAASTRVMCGPCCRLARPALTRALTLTPALILALALTLTPNPNPSPKLQPKPGANPRRALCAAAGPLPQGAQADRARHAHLPPGAATLPPPPPLHPPRPPAPPHHPTPPARKARPPATCRWRSCTRACLPCASCASGCARSRPRRSCTQTQDAPRAAPTHHRADPSL